MPSQFGNYDGGAYVPSGESAAQQPSGLERLTGMVNLLPPDLLGMLARLLQKPTSERTDQYGTWQTMDIPSSLGGIRSMPNIPGYGLGHPTDPEMKVLPNIPGGIRG